MKNQVLFIVMVLIAASLFAQRGVRIAYIDMEYILENVEEYESANSQLNAKAEQWKSEIAEKKSAIDQMRKNLSTEKILLTKELVQEREAEIQLLEKEMIDYQQDRFGPQGDLMIQRNLLAKPIQDQVFNAVQDIVKNKKYDFVFDKSADVVMLYSNKRHDISDLVLRSINRTKKQDERKAGGKEKKEVIEKPNPVAEAKKEANREKQEEKNSTLEDKKQKKIEDREARKKAYEERKKKILEEKEAKRKAKLEERQKKKNNTNTNTTKEENNNN